ncbi:MAG: aspartate/glutamate racemase family protein [Alphaproteobacteria bacterium]
MKILLVNPNITDAVTDVMALEARRSASPGVEIHAATAAFGAQYIETRVEAAVASHALLDVLAERAHGYDAVIVSAFGDPGLAAAKEMLDIPVVGLSEASLHTAYTLGRRIVVVCLTPRLRDWYDESAEAAGLADRLVGLRVVQSPVRDISTVVLDLKEPLRKECLKAVAEDRADVVILGGGPTAGLAHEIRDEIPVPLLDGVTCAVQLAEALVRIRPTAPTQGGFSQPGPKPTTGLSPALTTYFKGSRRNQ